MPTSISEAFDLLLSWLTPTGTETDAAKSHRQSVEQCLRANFTLTNFFRSGSFGNGTSVSGYSDIDYFAVISNLWPQSSSLSLLTNVHNVLARRFSTTTGIRIDCPAVRVPFGSTRSEAHEIVPARPMSVWGVAFPVYEIANCTGGWQRSSPDAHNDYVRRIDQTLNNRVKPLIRLVKAWKYYHDVPISSFYLELRVAVYAATQRSIVTYIDLTNIFRLLNNTALSPIIDPVGVSGSIAACANSTDLSIALMKLSSARANIDNAERAAASGNIRSAFSYWDAVYNGRFPGYYS